jgi:hypothetical protein
MRKRAFAVALSAAFLAGTSAAMVIVPTGQAAAEMAAPAEKPKGKSGMSGAERRKTCSAEWKEAKATGKTSNMKWPQFWSACNKRLKAQGA